MTRRWRRERPHTTLLVCIVVLLLAACAGKDTMASKSAAAYRDAAAKPAPVEVDHSAHAMTPDTDAAHGVATEHAEHGASPTAHAHADMQHDSSVHATMDHSQHGAMRHDAPSAHAGHEAMTPAAGTVMDHGAHLKAEASPPHSIEVPRANSEMARVRPAATLQQDAFDAPAPSAVAEAQKKGH